MYGDGGINYACKDFLLFFGWIERCYEWMEIVINQRVLFLPCNAFIDLFARFWCRKHVIDIWLKTTNTLMAILTPKNLVKVNFPYYFPINLFKLSRLRLEYRGTYDNIYHHWNKILKFLFAFPFISSRYSTLIASILPE